MNNNTAIVILNWNGRQFLELFLPQVILRSGECDVFVADNGSTDNSVQLLRNEFPSVKVIELKTNTGYTGGYNKALKLIDAKYYILLNSDIEVDENWTAPLIELMDGDPTIAAAQPKIRSFSEKHKFEYAGASGGFIDVLGYPFCRGRFIGPQVETDTGQYDDTREIFWATGAAMIVRADVYHELGGLDDNFFAHMEEIDLCWRFKRAGYKIMVCPQSVVYHVGGGTLPVWSPRKTYFNFRNNIAMLYKNLNPGRFAWVYSIRVCTDFLRLLTYLIPMKLSFAAAIFKGHKDFWKMRPLLRTTENLPKKQVSQIYNGSIVIRQIFKGNIFGKMMTLILPLLMLSCGSATPKQQPVAVQKNTPIEVVDVAKEYSHNANDYTQGLTFRNGNLYEGTGEYGHSKLKIINLDNNETLKSINLADNYFGEGIEIVGDKIFQLTWQEGVAFVYDVKTLKLLRTMKYKGEGWGLTSDGNELYLTDGSSQITVLDPTNFRIKRRLAVRDNKGTVSQLNELEWIDGKLWANIYLDNKIAIINPKNGVIEKYIDCSPLVRMIGNIATADVLNGIAYDKEGDKIYVTGKLWDKLFEIKNR